MSPSDVNAVRRFRRRILGWGALAALVLVAVGAPIYVRRIETDLERRAAAAIGAAGAEGVAVDFDGQEGALRCAAPLADPEAVRAAVADLRGVVTVSLDRSCRVGTGEEISPSSNTELAVDATTDQTVDATTDASTGSTATPPGVAFATVAELLAADPQFSIAATLTAEAGLTDELAGSGPVTLLVPVDEAFNALPADLLAALRQEPDALAAVLRHHAVEGATTTADLVDGDALVALDGGSLTVAATDAGWTVGGATILDADLRAGNGVVHALDRVLLPDGVAVDPTVTAVVRATLEDGVVRLSGVVADDEQRARLVDAALSVRAPQSVVDELVVDAATDIDPAAVEALATLLRVAPITLVTGVVGSDGTTPFARGQHLGPAAAATLSGAAGEVGADVALTARPDADATQVDEVQRLLDETLAATPITFEERSSVITDAAATLDRLAALAARYDGTTVTVEGYTDTGGATADNQALSEARAEAVRAAIEARGVPAAQLASVGFGESEPVLVDGVEDPVASRRIALVVSIAGGGG